MTNAQRTCAEGIKAVISELFGDSVGSSGVKEDYCLELSSLIIVGSWRVGLSLGYELTLLI